MMAKLFLFVAATAAVSPVQKVVQLLTDLKSNVERDMATDKELTQAFFEWAEKTEWEKNRDIEDGKQEVEALQAQIEDSVGRISDAEGQIESQSSSIAALEKDLESAEQIRKKENEDFTSEETEMMSAVDTLERAQVVLRKHMSLASKSSLRLLALSLKKVLQASWVTSTRKGALESLLQNGEGGFDFENPEAATYETKSGSIVEILAKLQDEAENALEDLRKGEMVSKHNFEMLKQGIEHELETRTSVLTEAQRVKSQAKETKAQASKNLASTSKALKNDETFLEELKMNWANKDSEHKENQQSFRDEIAAIEEAIAILTHEDVSTAMERQTPSLFQLRSSKRRSYKLTSEALRSLGVKFHSASLMQMASLARADPFGKVREMISQMIERLEKEAIEEANHKAWCDTETKANKAKIADRSAKLDKFSNRVEKLSADIITMRQEVERLESEIADIDASMAKATELRHKENDEFKHTKADCSASITAIQQAIQVLRNYYENGVAPTSSPQSMLALKGSRDHTANQGASTGIIGMLEVAEADFSRLLAESTANEDEASTSYSRLKQESAVSKASKQAEVKGKRQEIKSAENSKNNAVSDRDSTQEELDAVLQYQAKVNEQCTYKAPSFEDRAARREQEIAGLKNALDILQGEQVAVTAEPSFLQFKEAARRLRH